MEGGAYALQGTAGQPAVRIVGEGPYLGSGFWYAVRNETTALPVELTTFDAVREDGAVVLRWETVAETNNAGFSVQRSVEGAWQEVTFVSGAGTTRQPQAYRYADTDLPYEAETIAYRLKQVDTDGTSTYSDEIEIQRQTPERLTLRGNIPNPFRAQTTLRYALPTAGPVRMSVYDLMGRRVATLVSETQSAGRKKVVFRAQGLASGTYFVRLRSNGQTLTQRLTVVR